MCFILNHKIRNFVLSCAFTEWRRSSVAWKFNQVNVTVRKCLFHWPSLFAMNIIIPPDDRSVCFSSTVLRSFFSFSMTPGTSTASSLCLCRKLFFWYFRYPEPIPSVPVEDFTSICVLLLEVGVFFYIVYVYNVHNWMSTWCVLHALEQQRNWPVMQKIWLCASYSLQSWPFVGKIGVVIYYSYLYNWHPVNAALCPLPPNYAECSVNGKKEREILPRNGFFGAFER